MAETPHNIVADVTAAAAWSGQVGVCNGGGRDVVVGLVVSIASRGKGVGQRIGM